MAEEDNGSTDVDAKIAAAVEAAVGGLKKNYEALKNEKTQIKEQFDSINGLIETLGGVETLKSLGTADTVKQILEMRQRFEKEESGKLLTEGKYDEWFDKRVGGMRKDYENQISEYQKNLDAEKQRAETFLGSYRKKMLETEVASAATASGIEPGALLDVQLRAQTQFTFDQERDTLVIRDSDGGVVFGKDGKSPKSIKEWLDDQKEVSRHWWPPSKGGGAEGSGRGGSRDQDIGKLDMNAYAELRKKSGFRPGF